MQYQTTLVISDLLATVLSQFKINHSSWGMVSGSKPLKNLVKEIESGETRLGFISDDLVRFCRVSYVIVNYKNVTLVEEKTTWKDGRPPRIRLLPGSIAEKALLGETAEEAAIRGLKEELAIIAKPKLVCIREYQQDSPAYPGLTSHFVDTVFEVELSDAQYSGSGYSEKDNEKETFFVWKQSNSCIFPKQTILVN